jgi:hypothetical protein
MRRNGSGGLYGRRVWILYGPGIAVDAFRLLYRKSSRTGDIQCFNFLARVNLRFLAFAMQHYD